MNIDDQYLTAAQVKRRYGNCSDMKLWRWLHDEELNFAQPTLINGRRYWRLSDLQRFDAACIERQNAVDRLVVFDASDGIGLVVVHVARRNDQYFFGVLRDDLRDLLAQFLQNTELAGPDRDWKKR